VNQRQWDTLHAQWGREARELGFNQYALFNALTYWSSHTQDLRNPEVTRRNREDLVLRALGNPIFA